MRTYRIVVLPGDGIGPEVMNAALKVLKGTVSGANGFQVEYVEHPLGAENYRRTGEILPKELVEDCRKSDAVLLSAIGLPDVRLEDGTEVQPHQVVGLLSERYLRKWRPVMPTLLPKCVTQMPWPYIWSRRHGIMMYW